MMEFITQIVSCELVTSTSQVELKPLQSSIAQDPQEETHELFVFILRVGHELKYNSQLQSVRVSRNAIHVQAILTLKVNAALCLLTSLITHIKLVLKV